MVLEASRIRSVANDNNILTVYYKYQYYTNNYYTSKQHNIQNIIMPSKFLTAILHGIPMSYPVFTDQTIPGIDVENLYFPSYNGDKIAGTFFRPSSSKLMLYCLGKIGAANENLNQIKSLLRLFPDHCIFIFDYAGFGNSQSSCKYHCISGITDSLLAAMNISKIVDPHYSVFVHCGGCVPIYLVADKIPKESKVIFYNCFLNFWKYKYSTYPKVVTDTLSLFKGQEDYFDNSKYVHLLKAKTLGVTSLRDRTINPSNGKDLGQYLDNYVEDYSGSHSRIPDKGPIPDAMHFFILRS